ncbi:MAG: alpha/beta hydrolase, partial [Actinomycetota bacterium]
SHDDTGGDGPAVLFSHGFLMDRTMFDPQVQALRDAYRCISWDERGFGGTVAPGPFSYWDSADDAIGLLDHLGVDRAVLVGMSQGGFLSLRAALAHPDRVAALVLIDSQAGVDDAETIDGYRGMLHVFEHGSDDERAAVFEMVSGLILGDAELSAEWIPRWERIDRGQLVLAGGALLGRDDVSERIGDIGCPILAVHGTADQAIDIAFAHELAEAAVDHRGVVAVEGAAHAPNLTHPDEVNNALREFLASL